MICTMLRLGFGDVCSWTVISRSPATTTADFEAILTSTNLQPTTAQVTVRECSETMTVLSALRCLQKPTTTQKHT